MDVSTSLQVLSVGIEILAVIAGLALAVRKKKVYGWFISLTFVLYVIFDLTRIYSQGISPDLHSLVFLIASLSILTALWLIYREV